MSETLDVKTAQSLAVAYLPVAQRYFEWTGRIPVHAETGAEFPVNKEKAGLAKRITHR